VRTSQLGISEVNCWLALDLVKTSARGDRPVGHSPIANNSNNASHTKRGGRCRIGPHGNSSGE